MVYRISPENVRPPRGGPSGALAMVLVLAVVVGIYLFAGGDPGSRTGVVGDEPVAGETSYAPPSAAPTTDPVSGLPYVAPAALPEEALDTLVLVEGGGRLPSDRQGRPYDDPAGALPVQDRGYYTVHPVPPGTTEDPGPLLLVSGEAGERYYSDDGGATFARIGP